MVKGKAELTPNAAETELPPPCPPPPRATNEIRTWKRRCAPDPGTTNAASDALTDGDPQHGDQQTSHGAPGDRTVQARAPA